MNVLRNARQVGGFIGALLGALVWVAGTTWLGGRALWRVGVLISRTKTLLAETTRCPRGHRVPLYGVHRCASCRATAEGYIYRPCRFCGSRPAWTPCPKCRVSVPNPWL